MQTWYIASGEIRGDCGHRHRTIGTARLCAEKDWERCARLGGGAYSDRGVTGSDGTHYTWDHDLDGDTEYYAS